jgi:hypothetical protein
MKRPSGSTFVAGLGVSRSDVYSSARLGRISPSVQLGGFDMSRVCGSDTRVNADDLGATVDWLVNRRTQEAESALCRQLCSHGQVECVLDLTARGSRGGSGGFTD